MVAELNENNIVNVLGNTVIEATSDINLYATEGIGGDDRAATTGSMLSLSLVPYGVVVPDGAEVTSTNEVNIASTAYLEAGINNIAPVYLLPVNTTSAQPGIELPAGITYADLKTSEVLLTDAQKVAFGLVDADGQALDAELEFEAINVEKIGFFVDNGTVIEHAGDFFVLDPDFFTSSGSVNLVLQDEDYTDTDRWNEITISHDLSVNPTPTVSTGQIIRTADGTAMKYVGTSPFTLSPNEEDNNFDDPDQWAFIGNIYRSDVTDSLQLDLDGKIYVIKPVDLPDPILTYTNIGSLLVRQLEEVESWIASHAGDPEAIARYNVQREDILATMLDLGLLVDGQAVRELDTVLIDLPDIVSSAGSVFINVDGMLEADSLALDALVDAGRIVPNAGARIDILNRTPISMSVQDAIIEDNRRIEAIGGGLVVFTPGNVYLNGIDLTENNDDSAQDITILQDALLQSEYDFGGLDLPDVPQDLYISGDVINENGNVTISNREGSINVSGIIRGEQVEILSAKNFSLNTEGWFHTNQDPRQYIEYTLTRNTVFEEGKTPGSAPNREFSNDSTEVDGLQVTLIPKPPIEIHGNLVAQAPTKIETPLIINLENSIQRDESRIVSQGRITITAKYLNINGLIQSGTDDVSVDISAGFAPPPQTTALADAFNNPLNGITFGDGIPVDGYWDAANQRIVIEEIVPQGGEIILAGQIISTGNGLLRVANGYTNVRINNESGFDIFIERIDVTKNKEGRIQITDTSTGVGSAADPFERVEYTFSEGQVREQLYHGTLTPPNADGLITVDYEAVGTATGVAIGSGAEFEYEPVEGSQYFWVEGQEKTQTEVKYYKKNEFNLTGGLISWVDDNLVGDESYKWKTFAFTDERPLLESEGIIVDPATTDIAYSIEYKTRETFANEPIVDNWTTGGGWLQTKSYHKLVTTVSGVKDFYTHTLEADRPIAIDFVAGPSAPSVTITSGGSIDFGEINVPDTVDSSVSITTTSDGANILQSISAGIFGTNDVTITSSGSLRANIEGIKQPATSGFSLLSAESSTPPVIDPAAKVGAFKASGDIWIGFFETEAGQVGTLASNRQVVVDYIWSTDGNVFVSAPDGIFAKDNNSFIIGNQVELYSKEGMIGTSANPIFIDSDVHGAVGDGGVLAWAMGDIHIREMEGDLFLADQLDLAAGFDEENAEASEDNLKSTYDEIRPSQDGPSGAEGNVFRGSIHSTQGSVNIEVVGGSVIDNIAEGFVALTPEQIEARNARLGLGGEAGEAAALAELDADATAKTEAYHRYWKDFRHTMRAGTPIAGDTLNVSGVNTGSDTLTVSTGTSASAFETGDEVVIGGSVSDTDLANAGLARGASYYVIKLDDTHIQLATTRANAAITPSALNITGLASLADLELLRFDYAEAAFTPNQVPSTVPHDFTTASTPASVVTNQIVQLAADIDGGAEGRFGQKFIYVGTATLVAPNLGSIDYVSSPDWDLVVDPVYGAQQEVENAYESGDTRFGDPDEYDAGFVFTYTQAEKDAYVAANTFDLDALENPVSPGLMQALYPHAEFGSTVVNADSTEFVNITADEVNIVAGTKTAGPVGSIGSKSDIITINDPANFEALSDDAKIAMANASPDDIVGVHYKIYRYTGGGETGVDLAGEDFSGPWTEIATNFVTGTDATATVIRNVAVNQTVLVQLDSQSYGLYRATQNFTNINIANKAIYLGGGWERLHGRRRHARRP